MITTTKTSTGPHAARGLDIACSEVSNLFLCAIQREPCWWI